MSRTQPYQPLLLRLLHGINGLLILAAIGTGALIYNRYDGRFGKIPLAGIPVSIDFHGSVGIGLLFIFSALALYSFYAGSQRLVQSDTGENLLKVGKPQWWYALHRITNTVMLMAVTLALVSGRLMEEDWLKDKDFNHLAYTLHLSGWVLVVSGLVIHVLLSLKVGGTPLVLSMFSPEYRGTREVWPWQKKTTTLNREGNG